LTLVEACCYGAEHMRRILRTLLILAAGIAVLTVLLVHWRHSLARQGFHWALLVESVQQARPLLLLEAMALVYVCYALRALRWCVFSRSLAPTRFTSVYAATLMGFTAVFLLGRAGEPVRPLLIARRDRMPVSGMFGIYVLERVFDIASTVALFGAGLVVATHEMGGEGMEFLDAARGVGAGLLFLELLLIAFLVYFRLHGGRALERRMHRWAAAGGWRARLARAFGGFSRGLQAIRSPRDLVEAIAYSVAHWLLIAVVFLLVLRAFGSEFSDLTFADAILVLGVTMLGGMVQLPAVGGGAQAAAFFVLSGLFGYDQEPSAAAAIVLWLVTFAAVCLAGLPLLIHEGLSMRELWRMARPEPSVANGVFESQPAAPSAGRPSR
jgi:uncharacterized protein (TIRG00374 family)